MRNATLLLSALLIVQGALSFAQESAAPPPAEEPRDGAGPQAAAASQAPRRLPPDFEHLEALRVSRDSAQTRALELNGKADARRKAIVEENDEAKALSEKAEALRAELATVTNALEAIFAADAELSSCVSGAADARKEAMARQRELQEAVARQVRARQRRPAPPAARPGEQNPDGESASGDGSGASFRLPPDLKPHPRARPSRFVPPIRPDAPAPDGASRPGEPSASGGASRPGEPPQETARPEAAPHLSPTSPAT